ncbi:MAG: cytochrome c [Bacteroidetes bacterium]|nr:cytochrome c [Bacteroidota bacterium]
MFMPFLSLLLGITLLALFAEFKGKKQSHSLYLQFATECVETLVAQRKFLVLLGIVQYFAVLFAYIQLLQNTYANGILILSAGALLFILGTIFIYVHQFTRRKDSNENFQRSWLWVKLGLLVIIVSIYALFAGIEDAANPANWDEEALAVSLFSAKAIVKFVGFIFLSLAAGSSAVLFFYFVWDGGKKNISEEYSAFIKHYTLPIALIALLAFPIFLVINVVLIPQTGLTGILFAAVFLALLFVFFASHAVYGMMKEFKIKYAANLFYFLLLIFFFLAVADQSAVSSALQEQSAQLAFQYEKVHNELLSSMGVNLTVQTGEDIFTGKCSACHAFDKVVVGPAYKDVLPKYENDRAQLVSFILNPHKVNPVFPPMPNQGLKPAEADSIAAYIMVMYKK